MGPRVPCPRNRRPGRRSATENRSETTGSAAVTAGGAEPFEEESPVGRYRAKRKPLRRLAVTSVALIVGVGAVVGISSGIYSLDDTADASAAFAQTPPPAPEARDIVVRTSRQLREREAIRDRVARATAKAKAEAEAAEKAAAEAKAKAEAEAKKAKELAKRPPVSPGSARAIAKDMLDSYGWGDAEQWSCLDRLWKRESGWNAYAKNKSSGAYGIPQSLPGSKMASAGSDWETNPATQIKWGLGYIKNRYKKPCGAWAHSERVGWY